MSFPPSKDIAERNQRLPWKVMGSSNGIVYERDRCATRGEAIARAKELVRLRHNLETWVPNLKGGSVLAAFSYNHRTKEVERD